MTEAEKLLQETKSAVVAETQTEDICVIDSNLRIASIPEQFKILGVEHDKDVRVIQFKLPKMYKDLDLSAFTISVNFLNAKNEKGRYLVTDKSVSGDQICFSWSVGNIAVRYKGNTRFIVCMRLTGSDGEIQKEFNTTLATMTVLEGLEVDNPVIEQGEKDIVAQLLQIVDEKSKEAVNAVKNAGTAQKTAVEGAGTQAVQSVENAQQAATEAVGTAKTTAVQAVQAEGSEQLKSIKAAAQDIIADRKQIRENSEEIEFLTEKTLGSINYYNPNEQTPETISPHYYFNGKPYQTTDFDKAYNCTAPIAVAELTQYSIVLIPNFNGIEKPWHQASQGLFFYDEKMNYLGHTEDSTFDTPAKTAYVRFNYALTMGVLLDVVNKKCVITKGNKAKEYIPYVDKKLLDRIVELEEIAQQNRMDKNFYYEITNESLKVMYPYSATKKILIELKRKGGNDLFDFYRFATFNRDIRYENVTEKDLETIQTTPGDWHSPFIVAAKENADGEQLDKVYFTGGNHQYNNEGYGSTPTAESVFVKFFIETKEIISGTGYADKMTIRWENLVQGYNTTKANGSGRAILKENHRMIFDGKSFKSDVKITALESITLSNWYCFQIMNPKKIYKNIAFVGSKNRKNNAIADTTITCMDSHCENMVAAGDEHRIELAIDTSVDLGRDGFYKADKRMFATNYGKAYCTFVDSTNPIEMENGDVYRASGNYRFATYAEPEATA